MSMIVKIGAVGAVGFASTTGASAQAINAAMDSADFLAMEEAPLSASELREARGGFSFGGFDFDFGIEIAPVQPIPENGVFGPGGVFGEGGVFGNGGVGREGVFGENGGPIGPGGVFGDNDSPAQQGNNVSPATPPTVQVVNAPVAPTPAPAAAPVTIIAPQPTANAAPAVNTAPPPTVTVTPVASTPAAAPVAPAANVAPSPTVTIAAAPPKPSTPAPITSAPSTVTTTTPPPSQNPAPSQPSPPSTVVTPAAPVANRVDAGGAEQVASSSGSAQANQPTSDGVSMSFGGTSQNVISRVMQTIAPDGRTVVIDNNMNGIRLQQSINLDVRVLNFDARINRAIADTVTAALSSRNSILNAIGN